MKPDNYLAEAIRQFRKLKDLAERAIAQVGDEDLFARLDEESNSLAIIMKHMAGNMRSRWTDFLASDGEKPDRNREREFVTETGDTRDRILERWNGGWHCLFEALAPLTGADLGRTVLIRGEAHSVIEAINRQLIHYAYHVGQIVFLAKHYAASTWQSLSIPRGKSEESNAAMRKRREQAP
ncbi:MAG: DUF1572 family protein [candidate division NC10 bacterium]|nr:DUF1572 family protein [candidate division NC10 bacterium]